MGLQVILFLVVSNYTAIGDQANIPLKFELKQNYPSPFNPQTTIEFSIKSPGMTRLSVYNLHVEQVARLIDGEVHSGNHKITWNGKNKSGNQVASGTYIYRLITKDQQSSIKMILIS